MSEKTYLVGIVGEQSYQPAVKATDVGDFVDFVIELENPYSKSGTALRVDNMDQNTIGYIPEDHWLYRAIVEEGKGCFAKVEAREGKTVGIVLKVRLGEEKARTLKYGEKLPKSAPSGCLGVLVFILIGVTISAQSVQV